MQLRLRNRTAGPYLTAQATEYTESSFQEDGQQQLGSEWERQLPRKLLESEGPSLPSQHSDNVGFTVLHGVVLMCCVLAVAIICVKIHVEISIPDCFKSSKVKEDDSFKPRKKVAKQPVKLQHKPTWGANSSTDSLMKPVPRPSQALIPTAVHETPSGSTTGVHGTLSREVQPTTPATKDTYASQSSMLSQASSIMPAYTMSAPASIGRKGLARGSADGQSDPAMQKRESNSTLLPHLEDEEIFSQLDQATSKTVPEEAQPAIQPPTSPWEDISDTPDEKAPSTPTRLLAMDSAPGRVEFEPTYLQVPKLAAVPSEAQSTSSSQELLTYPAKFGLKAQTTLIRRKTGADVFSAEKEAHEVGLLQAACDYLNKKHPQAGGKGLGPRVALSDVKLRVHRGRPLVLGEGAFGKVYLGRMFGKDCAVKTICEGTRREQARFLREIRILETLRTEHVVKYMGWSVCPEGLVMLMEYCPGGNLTQALAKNESDYQYYKRGKDAMLSIASALIHLHDQSIAHLDIKSLNVLIAGDGSVKLADVGLSRLVKNERTVLSGPNTYAWASPEQLENFAGTAADIWSFGTTLWEVCTCEKPPSNRILRPIEVDEEAPKEAVELINDCHEADWQKRLTAHQLFARLKACPWKRFQFET